MGVFFIQLPAVFLRCCSKPSTCGEGQILGCAIIMPRLGLCLIFRGFLFAGKVNSNKASYQIVTPANRPTCKESTWISVGRILGSFNTVDGIFANETRTSRTLSNDS
jgi:hypothetical protein